MIAGLAAGLHVWAASAQTPGDLTLHGTLTALHVDDPRDRFSSGTIVVRTDRVAVPATVTVQMPGDQLTLQKLFALAPPTIARVTATRGGDGALVARRSRRPTRTRGCGARSRS